MTTWYTQIWTNQHLEQVKLNPFLRFSRFQFFVLFISGTRRESGADKESTEYAEIKPQ